MTSTATDLVVELVSEDSETWGDGAILTTSNLSLSRLAGTLGSEVLVKTLEASLAEAIVASVVVLVNLDLSLLTRELDGVDILLTILLAGRTAPSLDSHDGLLLGDASCGVDTEASLAEVVLSPSVDLGWADLVGEDVVLLLKRGEVDVAVDGDVALGVVEVVSLHLNLHVVDWEVTGNAELEEAELDLVGGVKVCTVGDCLVTLEDLAADHSDHLAVAVDSLELLLAVGDVSNVGMLAGQVGDLRLKAHVGGRGRLRHVSLVRRASLCEVEGVPEQVHAWSELPLSVMRVLVRIPHAKNPVRCGLVRDLVRLVLTER